MNSEYESAIPKIKIESYLSPHQVVNGGLVTKLYLDGYEIQGLQELTFHIGQEDIPTLRLNLIANEIAVSEKEHSVPDSHNLFGDLSPDELAKLGERLRETMDDVPLTLRPPETYKEN